MNKTIFTLLLFFFINVIAFAQQSGKAYYTVKTTSSYNKSLDSIDKISEHNPLKNLAASISELNFVLSFNGNLALFEEDFSLVSEHKSSISKSLSKILVGSSGPIFYQLDNKMLIFQNDIGGSVFLIERPLDHYKWELSKRSMTINNLKCYKATTVEVKDTRRGQIKEPITAWYTTDINIPIGPAGYAGLPGLIIQVERGNYVYTLHKIEFTDRVKPITLPTKGKKMSQKEFDALMTEMNNNRSKY